jgi:AcrR family transcriptional regulator
VTAEPGAVPARRGRRRGGGDTRAEILAAARAEFAAKGYDGASVRGIARAAGVDPALVHHYFGTKEQVFVTALQLPFDPSEVVPRLVAGTPEELGERIVRFFLSVWERPDARAPFLTLLGAAMTNEPAAAMLRGFVTSTLLQRIAASLHAPDAGLRVTAAVGQLLGVGVVRYVVRVEPLASASVDEVVALVAPTVQRYLAP